MKSQIATNRTAGCFHIGRFTVQLVFHMQHIDVRSQCHLANTVPMKIELIFSKIVKVFADSDKLLQCLQEETQHQTKVPKQDRG